MNTILLTDFDMIRKIYHTHMKRDFPSSELKPLAMIRKARERGQYDCYGMFESDRLIGYAFFVKLPVGEKEHYLLDYLAIVKEHRDQGCGSEFLKQLSELIITAGCIIAEVEDPGMALNEQIRQTRERRLCFYLQNGFRKTNVTANVFGVDYLLLETKGTDLHSEREIKEIYSELYKSMLPLPMYQAFVKIKRVKT